MKHIVLKIYFIDEIFKTKLYNVLGRLKDELFVKLMINGKHVIIKTVLICTDLIKLLYKFLRISLATDPN